MYWVLGGSGPERGRFPGDRSGASHFYVSALSHTPATLISPSSGCRQREGRVGAAMLVLKHMVPSPPIRPSLVGLAQVGLDFGDNRLGLLPSPKHFGW
jgi:hypothetical protein